jgi:hypothetical protein
MHCSRQIIKDDVQFEFTNTTTVPQTINLFSYLGPFLPNTPALVPQHTVINTQTLVSGRQTLAYDVRNEVYIPNNAPDVVNVLSASTGTLLYTLNLVLGSVPTNVAIDTVNNQLFVACQGTQRLEVYDLNTPIPTLLPPVILPNPPGQLVFNPTLQKLYCINGAFNTQVVDTNINNLIANIPNPNGAIEGVFCSVNNTVYTFSIAGAFRIINCVTDTLLATLINIPATTNRAVYEASTNEIYVVGTDFYAISCATNLPIANFSLAPNFALGSGIGYDTNQKYVYCFDVTTTLIRVVDTSTFTIINSFNTATNIPGTQIDVGFSAANNYLFIPAVASNTTATLNTVPTATNSIFVTGTSDYNAFVRDLEDNPIQVEEIRFIVQNQNQFDNVLNVKYIDANGVQTEYPRFPILDLSIFQFQSQLAVVKFQQLIFNGKIFFADYVLNPNETVILTMKYWQLWKRCLTNADFYTPYIYRFNDMKELP